MRICSVCELKNKEIINVCDGARLGYVSDVELDLDSGRVISLIAPGQTRLFDFGKCEPIRILWCDIERIGEDVILARRAERLCVCENDRPPKKIGR